MCPETVAAWTSYLSELLASSFTLNDEGKTPVLSLSKVVRPKRWAVLGLEAKRHGSRLPIPADKARNHIQQFLHGTSADWLPTALCLITSQPRPLTLE